MSRLPPPNPAEDRLGRRHDLTRHGYDYRADTKRKKKQLKVCMSEDNKEILK